MPRARLLLGGLVALAYGLVLLVISGLAVSPAILLVAWLALFATVNLGTTFLNLGVFLDVVSRGEAAGDRIALTFDDGPHPVHTRAVLRILAEADAKATFFVIGQKAEAHPDVIREIVAGGHELGLHSQRHDRFLNLRHEPKIIADLRQNQETLFRIARVRPILFRPPVGFSSPRTRVAVRAMALRVIGWSHRVFDGAARPSVDHTLGRLTRSMQAGSIVLLHDAPERGDLAPSSIEALPLFLAWLRKEGLRTTTVTELLHGAPRTEAEPQMQPLATPGARRD